MTTDDLLAVLDLPAPGTYYTRDCPPGDWLPWAAGGPQGYALVMAWSPYYGQYFANPMHMHSVPPFVMWRPLIQGE